MQCHAAIIYLYRDTTMQVGKALISLFLPLSLSLPLLPSLPLSLSLSLLPFPLTYEIFSSSMQLD